MRSRWLLAWCVPVFLCAVGVAPGQDKAADAPGIVVRVKSLDALLKNLNLVVRLVGQEEAAHQIEAVVKSKIGKKGIEGIDPARPIGAYVRFGKELDDLHGAILIPIADQKTFLTLLDNLGVVYKKDQAGVYTHKTNKNVDVYFRFANQYLYITSINASSIKDKVLPDPAKALAISGDATITVLARIDQIPVEVKQVALFNLDESIQAAKKNALPNETKVQEAFRSAILDDAHKMAKNILTQAGDIRLDIDLSERTKELAVNFSIAAKPKTELAQTIRDLGNFKSPLAGIVKSDPAFHGAFHFALPRAVHQAFEAVVKEASARSLEGIQDKLKKKQAETLFNGLMPTVAGGEYQVVAAILGPKADRYTFLGAIKLKDGAKLAQTVHDLTVEALKQMPEAEQKKITLNFETVGAVKIHRFEAPKNPAIDALISDVAGDKYFYVAFRDDALFLALGTDSLATLKAALANKTAAASTPLIFDVDVARMAKWLARSPQQKAQADKLLADGQSSRIRVSVEGGESLRINLRTHFQVLEFLVKTGAGKAP